MYFPHTYRSLNGREGGKDGLPVNYDSNELIEIELYDLINDKEETINVVTDHPEIVAHINDLAEIIRSELGDKLTNREGSGVREPGTIDEGSENN